jgi:hypothetical protein
MTNTPTTRDRVLAAAVQHGWTPGNLTHTGSLTFHRGDMRVFVGFDRTGAVSEYAFQTVGQLAARTFDGRDKAGRLIGQLSERKVRAGDVQVGDVLVSVGATVTERTLTEGLLTLTLSDGRKVTGANTEKLVTVQCGLAGIVRG